jgi:hypothetical protein
MEHEAVTNTQINEQISTIDAVQDAFGEFASCKIADDSGVIFVELSPAGVEVPAGVVLSRGSDGIVRAFASGFYAKLYAAAHA